ncbi:hypothetical protein [Zeaxanthinibacter enoshimensis]|uniref:Uncharacterized protein n=1 Tax=Zeaxanthinibacter enoshimensis TaxID=392009 RepID=A0A4R6TNQ9_9FLAO|nr:hypothetical protein [Zeaxanthinibacter enoshimensis]TDQ33194.1 hypothetical protein CLV82_1032 [Zeaxanthinibacter enoshimensis]
MKQGIILLFLLLGCIYGIQAQDSTVNVGDEFTIQQPEGNQFNHLDFPRPNFLIKKGILPDYKSLAGIRVVVADVSTDKEGHQVATLQPVNRKQYFRHYREVTAHVGEALQSGELSR